MTPPPTASPQARMDARTPYDGKPYYCVTCGLGFGEFMACEDGDCDLESGIEAEARAALRAAPTAEG